MECRKAFAAAAGAIALALAQAERAAKTAFNYDVRCTVLLHSCI